MKVLFITFFILTVSYGCNISNKPAQIKLVDKMLPYAPGDSTILYFPLDSIFFISDSNRQGDSLSKSEVSEILYCLKEPVIYNYHGDHEIFRFLWLRAFDNPIVIRLNKDKDTFYTTIKTLKRVSLGSENYSYKIVTDTIIRADGKKWAKVLSSALTEQFWNAPTADTSNYKDATMWIFESRIKENYHCIVRTYLDSSSFKNFDYAKELFNLSEGIVSMKNTREPN